VEEEWVEEEWVEEGATDGHVGSAERRAARGCARLVVVVVVVTAGRAVRLSSRRLPFQGAEDQKREVTAGPEVLHLLFVLVVQH
jgi:hypothetical protein